jgi:hypothetical protein
MQSHSEQDQTAILVGLFHKESSSLQGTLVVWNEKFRPLIALKHGIH